MSDFSFNIISFSGLKFNSSNNIMIINGFILKTFREEVVVSSSGSSAESKVIQCVVRPENYDVIYA